MFQVPESLRRVDPWDATVEIGGAHFQALAVPTSTYDRLLIVNGLPDAYRDDLLVGAQESPHKHTWRVIPGDQRYDPAQRDEVLRRAGEILDRDVRVFDSQFVTFVGQSAAGALELIGCAAVRRAMSETYRSSFWYIINRALVLPRMQGLHFGRLLIPLTRISRHMAGEGDRVAAGFFISTRAPAVRHIVLRGLRSIPGRVMPLGMKPLDTFAAPVDVGVFAGVAEWLDPIVEDARRRDLLDRDTGDLLARVQHVWWHGGDAEACAWMGARLPRARERLRRAAEAAPELAVHLDFLESAAAWQVLEPV